MERSNLVVDYKCAERYKGMVLLILKSIPIRVVAEAIRGALVERMGAMRKEGASLELRATDKLNSSMPAKL